MRDKGWLLVALACAVVGCGEDEETCFGPDGPLAAGETFTDDCNDCTCNEDGSITCVENQDCAACTYEGTGYAVGETWPAGDGCNICTCDDVGVVSCTEVACTN